MQNMFKFIYQTPPMKKLMRHEVLVLQESFCSHF